MAVNTEEENLFKLSEAKRVSLNMNIKCAEAHIDFGLLRIDGIIHSLFSFVCSLEGFKVSLTVKNRHLYSALFASCLCFTHFITLLCSNKQTRFGRMMTQRQHKIRFWVIYST